MMEHRAGGQPTRDGTEGSRGPPAGQAKAEGPENGQQKRAKAEGEAVKVPAEGHAAPHGVEGCIPDSGQMQLAEQPQRRAENNWRPTEGHLVKSNTIGGRSRRQSPGGLQQGP